MTHACFSDMERLNNGKIQKPGTDKITAQTSDTQKVSHTLIIALIVMRFQPNYFEVI